MDGFPAWFAVVPLFPVLWIGFGMLLSWCGGWRVLARAYRLTGEFDGRRWRFRSVLMCYRGLPRCTTYRSSLTLGANAHGLYLAVPLFGGHPPIFVPWADVRLAKYDRLFLSYLEFRFQRAEGVWLRLSRHLGTEVAAAGGLAVPT